MDRSARRFDFDAETFAPTSASTLTMTSPERSFEADPAHRAAFEAFAVAARDELAPRGVFESIFAERAVLAAWRLREAVEAERVGEIECLGADSSDVFGQLADRLRRQSDSAERQLDRALRSLAEIRGLARTDWGQAATLDTTVAPVDEVASDQYPCFPEVEPETIGEFDSHTADECDDFPLDTLAEDDATSIRWQDRLVLDANVSEDSPVVKGTWVTVSQIVSLIVDGFTWADILRSHPELVEDDIRACLAFAIEQESDRSGGDCPY
jgi:uncharacterized protein (DUF433 family)